MQLFIQEKIQETTDAASFKLVTVEGTPIPYKAGQFITLLFATPFGEKRRSYSFSSSPEVDEIPTITIKKIANGEFSRKLVEQAKPGDQLLATAVSGLFTLPEKLQANQQFFFFAAGSGITPCYSLIKTLLHTTDTQVVLIYSNRDQSSTIFYQDLLNLQQRFKERFQLRFLFSELFDIYNSRLGKWLLPQLLEQYKNRERKQLEFYICGPWDYMQMIQLTLLAEDISHHQIHKENFSTLPRLQKPQPPDTASRRVQFRFYDSQKELIVQYPNSILAAAKAAGIPVPYSCEAGRCGSCVATCTSGKVWMAYNEILMEEEIAAGRFLCCQAYPVGGDVQVQFP